MQKIIFNTEKELLSFFRKFKGKNLSELKNLLSDEIDSKINANKGIAGQIFEGLTGRVPNSSPMPDIEELGIDLKVLPLREGLKKNSFVSKERSKLKAVNYKKLLTDKWETAYVRKKIDKILFNVYHHPAGYRFDELEQLEYIDSFIFNLDERREQNDIRKDWEKLKNEVCSLKAHNISEKMFKTLSASTSGIGRLVDYHQNAPPAKERSHSFKNAFMTTLWKEYDKNDYASDVVIDEGDFVSFITNKIDNTIKGKMISELLNNYEFSSKSPPKNIVNSVLNDIIGIKKGKKIREFDLNDIVLKTVPVNPDTGNLYESMSFPKMSLRDLLFQEWDNYDEENSDESALKTELVKNLIFIPIYKRKLKKGKKYVFEDSLKWKFGKPIHWTADAYTLEAIKKEWIGCKKLVMDNRVETKPYTQKNGKIIQKNNLLKSSQSEYIHIRPHTSDSSNIDIPYYNHTNGKISISWQSFWLNKSFVKTIINNC